MANFGKRMVKEPAIKQIGQVPEYTAGTGISIDSNNEITANIKAGSGIVVDTDLTDDSLVIMTDDDIIQTKLTAGTGIDITTNTISVDSSIVAMKSDLDDYQYAETYTFTDNPFTTPDWLTKVPVLATNNFTPATDTKFGNNPVITLDPNNRDDNLCYLKGYFVIRDTANDTYSVFITQANSITSDTDASAFSIYLAQRSGNNDWTFMETFYREVQSVTDADSNTFNVYRLGRRTTSDTTVIATGLSQATYKFKLSGSSIAANKNYPNGFQVPTTQGTYLLRATVDANGKLDKFDWVPEADYLNV